MTAADLATAVEQYVLGDSAATIGRRLSFDTQTVLNGLRTVGTPIRHETGTSLQAFSSSLNVREVRHKRRANG